MKQVVLGRTGLTISRLAFGAGPVSGLMTGNDYPLQRATLARALESGINWIDTAAGYGQGSSEANLGRVLTELKLAGLAPVHVATKVRIDAASSLSFREQVESSVAQSLARLGCQRVTLLQLHNGVTARRDDEPASLSADDVLRPDGAADALAAIQRSGLAQFIGLTGTGSPADLRSVICSDRFDTIQLPYNLLNPSAGQVMPAGFAERDYGNILHDCQQHALGVFAIRVLAGGALLGQAPSAHTLKTPYFPLDLYTRDTQQAVRWQAERAASTWVRDALEFVWRHPAIHGAIVGFGSPDHVTTAVEAVA